MRVITRVAGTLRSASFWLWTVQGLLAMLFLFSGSFKAFAPMSMMQLPFPMPEWFIRFLGYAELTGAIGLVLPSLLRIKPRLTPIAAFCLLVIMAGATVISLFAGGIPMASLPFVVGLLVSFVAYGRTRLAPLASRTGRTVPVAPYSKVAA
jgi:uncharacterized membrane protein YphA (DoxX/SURF4 family)